MRKYIIFSAIAVLLSVFCCSAGIAQNKPKERWDELFVQSLHQIKNPQLTDGLGFTLSEEEALQTAINKAMEQKAPACQALKIAVEMKFNPYEVISGIFNSGAKIDLEQLCLCATDTGDSSIPRNIMVQAANDAAAKGKIRRDEVTQSQCLQRGLGFTLAQNAPEPISLPPRNSNYSSF